MEAIGVTRSGPPGVNSRSASAAQSAADLEVLGSIEQVYFSSPKEFDASRHVLEQAPEPPDIAAIERLFSELKRQQQVVSGKALHLISQQRDNCDRQFREVQSIRESLSNTLESCREARTLVQSASEKLAVNTLTILANYRKRQLVKSHLRSLELLRTLRDVDRAVNEKLARKDYETAIALILKCRKATSEHREYICMEVLSNKLQDNLEMTEEKLDNVLASLCRNFDDDTFSRLRKAHGLLGKTQAAMEQLHMHYASAVNETSVEAVKVFTTVIADKFQDLCNAVPTVKAPNCLLKLCENLFYVMRSYYLLVIWHQKYDHEDFGEGIEFEKNISKEYIRQKLKNGLARLWHDVQAKVSIFLKSTSLGDYPFEKFIQILGILRKLTQVAEVFCGDKSDFLQDFIKTQSISYIKNYHCARMEELKLFLENEGWEQCPVKNNFNLLSVPEFKPFKKHLQFKGDVLVVNSHTMSDGTSSVHSQDDSEYIAKYFTAKSKHTPFQIFHRDDITNDDIFGLEPETEVPSDSDDEPEELKRDYIDENVEYRPAVTNSPIRTNADNVIVTNTTLSVLRHCGQYLQLCRYLQPIALDVTMLMFQLFDYYLFTVHLFFTADREVSSGTLYTVKLNATLKRIANFVEQDDSNEKIGPPTMPEFERKVETLHCLSERIVAIESVIFLTKQFETLLPYLESIVAPHQKMILEYFRDNTLASAISLRNPVYMCSASKVVDARSVLISMSQVNWNLKNVAELHNSYVDSMVRDLQIFALRLETVAMKVTVNLEIAESVWSMVSKFVVHLLVEGFSNATKCSNAGRGLMQLDYTQLFMKFEKICKLKPIPYQEYVDRYVKAYYLPRAALEEFLKQRTEYSDKHLIALVTCACENKRDRQELTAVIERRDDSGAAV